MVQIWPTGIITLCSTSVPSAGTMPHQSDSYPRSCRRSRASARRKKPALRNVLFSINPATQVHRGHRGSLTQLSGGIFRREVWGSCSGSCQGRKHNAPAIIISSRKARGPAMEILAFRLQRARGTSSPCDHPCPFRAAMPTAAQSRGEQLMLCTFLPTCFPWV